MGVLWGTHAYRRNDVRGTKGISPLIAAVLLIAIAVIISTLILSWGTAITLSQQSSANNRSAKLEQCNPIEIEDIYLDFQSNRSTIVVRANSGSATIVSAEMYNNLARRAVINTTLPMSLQGGGLGDIGFQINGTIPACGNFSQAIVSTSCIRDVFNLIPRGC